MLNLYNLIKDNIYLLIPYLVIWAILTIMLFLAYSKYLPEHSTKKSIIFSTVISFIFIILDFLTNILSHFPRITGNPYIIITIDNLFLAIIIGFVFSLIIYAIYNYKLAIKIGTITSGFIFLIFMSFVVLVP